MKTKWELFDEWKSKHPRFTWEDFYEFLRDGNYGEEYADVGSSKFYALAERMLGETN